MPNDMPQRSDPTMPPDTVTEPLPGGIDPENFTPRLISLLSNVLVGRESNEMRRRFQLGTNDWRVISALAIRPGSSASEMSDFLVLNKAIVSKSVNILLERGLVLLTAGPRGSHPLYLTQTGAKMHDAMLPISMHGQEAILANLSEADIRQLNDLLRHMLGQVRQLQAFENATHT